MKLILFFLGIFLSTLTNATTYYVSTTGSDATGTGTITNPWKTLYKATNTVAGVGDIIHVNAGTYLETLQCVLKPGVSIEGDGATSILKTTLTADWTELLSLRSPEGTNGNQHISNLMFDGQNLSTFWGIYVGGRSNVSIHDITMVDFKDRGVLFGGRNDGNGAPPTIYATGNTFYNNTITNCAAYNLPNGSYGRGCLNIGGQDGMLIYNNTISQTSRPEGYNGWPIKGWNEGYLKGCKIYNNTLNKIPLGNTNGNTGWNFAIELFNESGLEIYGNTITGGSIDLNFQTKNGYPYSVWIHDNVIKQTSVNSWMESGIVLEYGTDGAIIENNTIDKKAHGIEFNPRSGDIVKDVTIQRNLITNVTIAQNTGGLIGIFSNAGDYSIDNFNVLNNTMVATAGAAPWWGINLGGLNTGYARNINIKNNIITNIVSGWLVQGGAVGIDSLSIQNNNTFNNGGSNNPVFNGIQPTHYTNTNNIHILPLFISLTNFLLQPLSPCIDAGTYVGLTYSGSAPDMGFAEYGGITNNPPTANAGTDQSITLPTNTVTLTGSGTDTDGTISAYLWTKISGPTAGTIANSASATTTVTALVQGTYKFELKVTDNNGAVGRDTMQVIVNPDPNVPPTANAGPDQNITLPTNTVSLSGSGNDPDGTISAYLWTKISGPTAGTITNSAAAATTVTALVQGTYKFELKVTDNNGAIGRDTMQVVVNPAPNVPPAANAGPDQNITLPTNTVSLSGSGNDPDGTITAYLWTKIAGPTAGTITNSAAAATAVTGLVQGTYQFELKVTDNSGATAKDTMVVVVNPDPNIAPTANAGPDQNITLPTNTVSLSGSGNDPDGTISAYLWTKISGPTAGTITNSAAAATTVTALVQGTYKFELKVTDNNGAIGRDTMQVVVNPAPNMPPAANAGPDQNITLPTNTVSLSGSGNDPDGTITAYLWTKIAGPTAGTITNSAAAATAVTGLVQGTYQFELKVTDNSGATAKDTMVVVVNPDPNIAPTANAGPDQNITLPTNTVSLSGSGNDPDGTISAYLWTKISGPTAGTITNSAAAATTVTALVQGTYKFELKVTDNNGAIGRDTMQVVVNPAPNVPPAANAGPDQNITLPVNAVNLSGSGNDPDGTITAYLWTKIAGPTAGTITNSAAAATSVTGLVQGTYQFELKVTDNSGATDTDTMQVIVNPANIPPVANAGVDQNITLPVNAVNLSGSGNDPDGTITAYLWTKISGPAAGTITNTASAATPVTGLVQGTYRFELKVTDNSGAVGRDTMVVVVNPAPNVPPTANAGLDQSITLPTSSVSLSGSGIDPDGTITAYLWTKVSGPTGAGTITNPNAAATSVTALVAGIYKFELKVTDNSGATDTDTMQVIVFAPNIPPVADAGLNQSITLPTNTANLTGNGTDVDGTIVAYKWTRLSGPSAGIIANSSAAVTTVTGLITGVYVFELKVTDNNGATATDNMQVTVNPENIPPVANAGPDQSVMLPANNVLLTGTGTDVDGTIIAYAWRQISGPPDKLTSINTASTFLQNLVDGSYKFELTVTDNRGATDKDTVNVKVATPVKPDNNSVKVYPNPVVDFTTLDINSTIPNTTLLVVITDMQGKMVYQKQLVTGTYNTRERINMSTLSKGTYLMTVYFDSINKQSIKVIKP
ncbi:PKD domain-containing protein [Ferruginibacter profundus]